MGASVKVHLHPFLPGGGLAAGGGADGGDDPWRRKYNLDRSHKLDSDEEEEEEEEENDDGDSAAAVSSPLPPPPPPRGRKGRMSRQAAASEFCQVCNRGFASAKALHGHMRTHPQRTWRGVLPPSMRPGREREVADSLILLSGKGRAAERRKYPCKMCGREFETRQALGGHRASHRRQEGCFARAAGRPPVQPLGEEEDCAAQSSALVMGPCPPRTSAVASTSTKTVQEQDSSSGVTRRRALDLNQQLPLQSSGSTNGGSVAGDDRANRDKSSDSGDRNNNGVK